MHAAEPHATGNSRFEVAWGSAPRRGENRTRQSRMPRGTAGFGSVGLRPAQGKEPHAAEPHATGNSRFR